LARAETGAGSGTVIVAERQRAGRGRQGRTWFAAPGDGLTFSLLWRCPPGSVPAGLSLAVGIAIAETLRDLGWTATQLKWPNDILLEGRKLGGVLIELAVPLAAVIGIGINCRLPAELPDEVRGQAAALGDDVDRNRLLASLLLALHAVLAEFAAGGFAPLRSRWLALDAYAGRAVRVGSAFAPTLAGRDVGIGDDGALLLETVDGVERVIVGDVSLRLS
jgi:BirA family biotin operon repressor/biotin-[acetyl-CoA-carboxylase] ligase